MEGSSAMPAESHVGEVGGLGAKPARAPRPAQGLKQRLQRVVVLFPEAKPAAEKDRTKGGSRQVACQGLTGDISRMWFGNLRCEFRQPTL